jgi:hypothetical protein
MRDQLLDGVTILVSNLSSQTFRQRVLMKLQTVHCMSVDASGEPPMGGPALEPTMPLSLPRLETRRTELLRALGDLKEMRGSSIVAGTLRCRKPNCQCSHHDDPSHGLIMCLTYRVDGKTVTEALLTPAAVRKAEPEIAEFSNYQKLGHELVGVNRSAAYDRSKKR